MATGVLQDSERRAYKIVVGVDFSETGDYALWEAFALARQQAVVEVHCVYAATGYGPLLELTLPNRQLTLNAEEAEQFVAAYVEERGKTQLDPDSEARIHYHVRVGHAADEIVDLAYELEADLLVVGTHSRKGVKRFFVGSVTEAVVRHCPCPVLVVRPKVYDRDPHGD